MASSNIDNSRRCELTLYADAPAFNVEIKPHLIYLDAIKKDNSITSGTSKAETESLIQFGKIDAGANHTFVFYIYNLSPDWVYFMLPEIVTFQSGPGKERREIAVIKPNEPTIPLSPREYPP